MNARTLKSTEQRQAEALGKTMRAEVKRLKREGTREDALRILKGAGILNAQGQLAKQYKPA